MLTPFASPTFFQRPTSWVGKPLGASGSHCILVQEEPEMHKHWLGVGILWEIGHLEVLSTLDTCKILYRVPYLPKFVLDARVERFQDGIPSGKMVFSKSPGLKGELSKDTAHTTTPRQAKPRLGQPSWLYVGDLILPIRIARFNGLHWQDQMAQDTCALCVDLG